MKTDPQKTDPQKTDPDKTDPLKALQKRSLQYLTENGDDCPDISTRDVRALIGELQLRQTELEMKNDALHRTQRALEASQRKYFDLYDRAPVGYMTLGSDGTLKEVNLAAATLLGTGRSRLINRPFSRVVATGFEDTFNRHLQNVIGSGAKETCAIDLVRKDGTRLHVQMESIADDGGTRIRSVVTDISQRKRMEDALRESEDRYRQLYQNESDAVMIFDAETHRFEDANPAALELYGHSREEFLSLTVEDISAEPNKTRAAIEKIQTEQPGSRRIPLRYFKKKDGSVFPGEVASGTFTSGGRNKIIGAVRDITTIKQTEEALRNRSRELGERVKELYCLFEFSSLLAKGGRTLAQTLQGVVDLIVTAWQYPDVTCSRIVLDEKTYQTSNFRKSTWKQSCDITVQGRPRGVLEIFYLEKKADRDEGPFLKEEIRLLNVIAERLGKFVERFQVQDALRNSEATARALLNAPRDLVMLLDVRGVFVDVNDAVCRAFGKPADELVGRGIWDLFDLETAQQRKSFTDEVIRSGNPIAFEDQQGGKWWSTIVYPVTDSLGKVTRVALVARDITARRQADEKLRESEERYRSLVDNIAIGVALISPDMEILTLNKQMQEWFPAIDLSRKPVCYRSFNDPPGQAACTYCPLVETFRDGGVHEAVTETPAGDEFRYYRIVSSPIKNQDGQVVAGIEMVEDITDRREADAFIHNLSQQLLDAQENERQVISRELHDSVAQDLSTLKIAAQTLFDPWPAVPPMIVKKNEELIKILDRSILTVRNLAYDLRPPELDEIGLVETLAAYCEEFAENTGIQVDFRSAGLKKVVLSAFVQINLYRLVQEGLNNIRKHADATRAVIRLVGASPNIILRVKDDGRGFSLKERERTLKSERRMGIRSMRERTNLLNGQMGLVSKLGKGTEIFIKIPLVGPDDKTEKKHTHY